MTDREKLIETLSRYFDIGDSYAYNLTRVKTAFAVGTMSLEDFEEFDENTVGDIADYLIANGVVIREKGEWGKSEDDYCGLNIIQCPLCHEEWCFECDDDVEMLNYNFCPNCGSDMREGTRNG